MLQLNALGLSADDARSRAGKHNDRMLQQKMVLVERMLYQSPLSEQAKQQPSVLSEETSKTLNSARLAYQDAIAKLREDHAEQAHEQLDSALSLYRQASALNRGTGRQSKQLTDALPELRNRIAGYHESLLKIAEEKGVSTTARVDQIKIEATLKTATRLENQGDLRGAVQLLQVLQASLESELVRLRNGETIVTRVQINNIEDALDYEMQKNTSNETLLVLLFRRVSLNGEKRRVLSNYLQQSREASIRALQYRQAGDLEAALKKFEISTAIQIRALKVFGINL